MKHTFTYFFTVLFFITCCFSKAQNSEDFNSGKSKSTFIYFNPEIVPKVAEIEEATYDAFFSSVSDYYSNTKNLKMLRVQTAVIYDSVNINDIKESCLNNDAKFAVVPKIKFFKIGLGKYVLSSQVIVSMKFYDAEGKFLSENSYDTFRKKARILGSAENSVRLGTAGVLKMMIKDYRKLKRNYSATL